MKARTKSILSLTGVLIIGMVLGGLITMRIVHDRIDHIREIANRKGFKDHVIKAAKPTPEQEAKITPLLEDFGERMEILRREHLQAARKNMTELQDSLSNYLSEEQLKRVKKKLKRLHGRARKGRGPGMRPPPAHH